MCSSRRKCCRFGGLRQRKGQLDLGVPGNAGQAVEGLHTRATVTGSTGTTPDAPCSGTNWKWERSWQTVQ